MLDLRTLLVLMAAADLILAAALWMGANRGLRDGLAEWGSSLVVRALAFAVLTVGGDAGTGALAVGGALLALSITLQGAAMMAFEGRPFPAWIHTAVIAAVAVPLQLLERDPVLAAFFGGVVLGTLLMVVAAISRRIRRVPRSRSR